MTVGNREGPGAGVGKGPGKIWDWGGNAGGALGGGTGAPFREQEDRRPGVYLSILLFWRRSFVFALSCPALIGRSPLPVIPAFGHSGTD